MRSLIIVLLLVSSSSSFALTVEPNVAYRLLDHPDGALTATEGPYGLRVDALMPPPGTGPTFSVENSGASATLFWDGGTTATISGTLYNNTENNLWTVSHLLTGVNSVAGPDGGFTATGGEITLTAPDTTVYTYDSKPDGSGFTFLALGDAHRCAGFNGCGPLVARGWLETGTNADGVTDDWLVQLTPVPLPAGLPLLGIGLAMLGFGARRARQL